MDNYGGFILFYSKNQHNTVKSLKKIKNMKTMDKNKYLLAS